MIKLILEKKIIILVLLLKYITRLFKFLKYSVSPLIHNKIFFSNIKQLGLLFNHKL